MVDDVRKALWHLLAAYYHNDFVLADVGLSDEDLKAIVAFARDEPPRPAAGTTLGEADGVTLEEAQSFVSAYEQLQSEQRYSRAEAMQEVLRMFRLEEARLAALRAAPPSEDAEVKRHRWLFAEGFTTARARMGRVEDHWHQMHPHGGLVTQESIRAAFDSAMGPRAAMSLPPRAAQGQSPRPSTPRPAKTEPPDLMKALQRSLRPSDTGQDGSGQEAGT